MSTRNSTTGTFRRVTRPTQAAPHPSKTQKGKTIEKTATHSARKSPPSRPPALRLSPLRSASPTVAGKKRKQDVLEADDAPPPKKRVQEGRPNKASKLERIGDDEDDEDGDMCELDPELLMPTWADPLIELNARARYVLTPQAPYVHMCMYMRAYTQVYAHIYMHIVHQLLTYPVYSQATRLKEKYHNVYLNSRLIMRLWGFCASPDKIIAYAVAMHGIPAQDRPCQ